MHPELLATTETTVTVGLRSPRVATDAPGSETPGDEALFVESALRSIRRLARAHGHDHPHIVIACAPKSASTYLNTALVRATGFRSYLLNPIGHDTERDIRPLSVPMFLVQATVSQEHMRARAENVRWLRLLGVRPVVLVRDVFDAVVSARDHVAPVGSRGPAAHPPPGDDDPAARAWLAIRMGVPWLLDFFASWRAARDRLDVLFITYDDVVRETARTLDRIFGHVGLTVPAARVAAALSSIRRSEVRFNRGRRGRGRRELTTEQIRVVDEIAGAYRDDDLSLIGL